MENYSFGTGRRKTSIAQVRIFKGTGKVLSTDQKEISSTAFVGHIKKPLELLSQENSYDVTVKLSGGGFASQQDAAQLAIARALSRIDKGFESTLKKEGYLTRDSREKERKKPGLKRARRAPQWAKR